MDYPDINPHETPLPEVGEPYWDLIYKEVCMLPEVAATLVARLNATPAESRTIPGHEYSLHTMLLMVQMGSIMRQAWDIMLPVPGQSAGMMLEASHESKQEVDEFLRSVLESLVIARSGLEQAKKIVGA